MIYLKNLKDPWYNQKFNAILPNCLWCIDFTELNVKIEDSPKDKVKLLVVLDCGTAKAYVKPFLLSDNRIKKAKKLKRTPSVMVGVMVKCLQRLIDENDINQQLQTLFIHSDRGFEFQTEKYMTLEKDNPKVILSMGKANKPIDNAVVERYHRTFKNQCKDILPQIPKVVKSIRDLEVFCNKRVKALNSQHKNDRNLHLGADECTRLSKFFKINSDDETLSFNWMQK